MIWETILLGLRSIRRNVLRSTLTILGIVIGVAAVIIMVTLGNGATAQVKEDIGSLGSNMLQIRPGQGMHGPGGGARAEADMFDVEDATAISQEINGIVAVAPSSTQTAQAIAGNKNWSTQVNGTTNDYLQVRNWNLLDGRAFTESEQHAGAAVCLIGTTIRKEIFGSQDPIGNTMRLGTLSCQVIGILASKGQSGFGRDQDDIVIIPIRTLQRRITGSTDVDALYVSAQDGYSTDKIKEELTKLMRERRHIAKDKEDNFNVMDMQEIVKAMTSTTQVLTALLSAVAAVSLLVGGIGIMNIMLVSVTERTREIGTRLAIGALEREVLMQFLIEAVVLSSFGGIIGILLGLSIAAVTAAVLGMPYIISSHIVMIAFLFSAAVGVVFGYFPARQAARMDPIDALRHE